MSDEKSNLQQQLGRTASTKDVTPAPTDGGGLLKTLSRFSSRHKEYSPEEDRREQILFVPTAPGSGDPGPPQASLDTVHDHESGVTVVEQGDKDGYIEPGWKGWLDCLGVSACTLDAWPC